MLDLRNTRELIECHWNSLSLRSELPCSEEEYWNQSGPVKVQVDTQRRYNRTYLRGIGILHCKEQDLAVFVKDLSRMGIGFYSPVQLFPCDRVELQIPGKILLNLKIVRCLRIRDRCFECGSVFGFSTDNSKPTH